MKKILLIICIAICSLFSVTAYASEASKDLKTYAAHYLTDSSQMFGQGYFVGLVTGRSVDANICPKPHIKKGEIATAVANVILTDKLVDVLDKEYQVVDYALLKAFPCTNL